MYLLYIHIKLLLFSGNTDIFAAQSAAPVQEAGAQTAETNHSMVSDGAALLTEEEISSLRAAAEAAEKQTGWAFFLVTADDTGGRMAQQYADDFFDTHCNDEENGVVLLIDMDHREIYLSTAGEAIRYLTDARVDAVLDAAYEDVSAGAYADCLQTMADGVLSYYEKGIPRGQYNYDVETGERSVYRSITSGEILFAVLAALGAGIAVFCVIVGKYRLKFGTYEYDFHQYGSVKLEDSKDVLVNTVVTHRRIPKDTGNSGGSSSNRSSVHTSSGGKSHGGGGRSF